MGGTASWYYIMVLLWGTVSWYYRVLCHDTALCHGWCRSALPLTRPSRPSRPAAQGVQSKLSQKAKKKGRRGGDGDGSDDAAGSASESDEEDDFLEGEEDGGDGGLGADPGEETHTFAFSRGCFVLAENLKDCCAVGGCCSLSPAGVAGGLPRPPCQPSLKCGGTTNVCLSC